MQVELCPETGVGMIVKEDGKKIDLMPDEVMQIREAAGNEAKITEVLSNIDGDFAQSVTPEEVKQIGAKIK